jgi:hypothetical protein
VTTPLSEEQLAEIRADLGAVPAPPWRWVGLRGSGGPQLVTDHSGRQYLLRAKKPTDAAGDEVLDFATDAPVYGDLEFRDQRPGETYSLMRTGDQLAIGRTDYDPDSIVGVDNPVARWIERSAKHAAALLAEVERLRSAEHTAWHAAHDSDGVAFGHYTGRDAAMDHIHHLLAGEEHLTVEEVQARVIWRADDPTSQKDVPTAWECWLEDPDEEDYKPTGYVVTPISVAAAYAAAPAELDALAEREFATEAGHGADAESDGGS